MTLSLSLVVSACVHLRCVEKIFKILALFFSWAPSMPCWSTHRLWLLRVGYYKLTRPKVIAEDWAWIVDFTIQAGRMKCLVVVGVRLSTLGSERDSKILGHQDVEPIALVPMEQATGERVCQCLEEAIPQTGLPRQIIADEGSDVKAGIHQFQAQHPDTDYTYDIKHFTANLLEREFASDVTWTAFTQWATQSRHTLHQTAWSHLEPPAQRAKSRYMNMDILVAWGVKTLAFLDRIEAHGPTPEDVESIRCKLGWLSQFSADLAEWDQILRLIGATETQVRRQGLFRACDGPLRHRLRLEPHATERTIRIRWALIEQVLEASLKARPGECLLGSSEVLESIFGKFKYMQDEHARGGFTAMVLAIPALVAQTTQEVVQRAIETVPVATVRAWISETFGTSALAQRKAIYATTVKEEQKPDQFLLSA
jgi:hypothetical protein